MAHNFVTNCFFGAILWVVWLERNDSIFSVDCFLQLWCLGLALELLCGSWTWAFPWRVLFDSSCDWSSYFAFAWFWWILFPLIFCNLVYWNFVLRKVIERYALPFPSSQSFSLKFGLLISRSDKCIKLNLECTIWRILKLKHNIVFIAHSSIN